MKTSTDSCNAIAADDTAPGLGRQSLLRYAPGLILILAVIADSGQVTDPDLWGHIRFGQAALAGHPLAAAIFGRTLVTRDPYSYSAVGAPWRNHEWLTEIVMALFYNHLGVIGLKIWKFACVSATIFFLAVGVAETGAAASVQLYTMIVAAVALMPQMQFRPQLFTFMLFAAMLAILARHNYRGAGPLWPLVPLMALWSNLHGGFIAGLAALAVYSGAVTVCDVCAGTGLKRARGLAILTLAATFATMLTPYGIDTWATVIHALRNPVTRNVITDWHPLMFAMVHQWHKSHGGVIYYLCVIGFIGAFAVTFAMSARGGDLPLAAIAAMMSVAAFIAVRNMPLAVIACAAPLVRHSALMIDRRRGRVDATGKKLVAPAQRSEAPQAFAIAIAAALATFSGIFSPRLRTDMPYPAGAVAFMRERGLHGNVLGDFGWGEYLIWHTAPPSKVFIDGRYDTVFPGRAIDDYVAFYFDLPRASEVLRAYPHDFVLIPPSAPAFALMQKAPGWKLLYHDGNAVLYARASDAAGKIAGAPIDGGATATMYFP